MPRKKTIDAFRPEFEQLLLRAHEHLSTGAHEFSVRFATKSISSGMRSRTYQYFAALRESKHRPDLTAICDGLSMRCDEGALVFFRNEDSMEAVRLREALGLPRGFDELGATGGVSVAPSGLSSNLEQLSRIRSRKGADK